MTQLRSVFREFSLLLFVLLSLLVTSAPLQADLLSLDEQGVSFSLSKLDQPSEDSYLFRASAQDLSTKEVFLLEDPARIVIDLANVDIRKNFNKKIPQNPIFLKMRTGIHPDKYRIVLDLKPGVKVAHRWSEENQSLLLTVSTANPAQKTKPPQKKPVIFKSPRPAKTEKTAPEEKVVKAEKKESLPPVNILATRKKPIEKPTAVKLSQDSATADQDRIKEKLINSSLPVRLDSIKFFRKKPLGTPLIRLALTKNSKYSLAKKGEKMYHLTVPNCSIKWSHLSLPHFPPQDFKDFNLVMTEPVSSDLLVKIGVERGVRITAYTKDKEIWIKSAAGQ